MGELLVTVIHNAAIVTVDDDDAVHYDSAIAIDGDRIAAIGSTKDILQRYPGVARYMETTRQEARITSIGWGWFVGCSEVRDRCAR